MANIRLNNRSTFLSQVWITPQIEELAKYYDNGLIDRVPPNYYKTSDEVKHIGGIVGWAGCTGKSANEEEIIKKQPNIEEKYMVFRRKYFVQEKDYDVVLSYINKLETTKRNNNSVRDVVLILEKEKITNIVTVEYAVYKKENFDMMLEHIPGVNTDEDLMKYMCDSYSATNIISFDIPRSYTLLSFNTDFVDVDKYDGERNDYITKFEAQKRVTTDTGRYILDFKIIATDIEKNIDTLKYMSKYISTQ